MAYAVQDILLWARISQVLAGIGEAKKKYLQSKSVEPDLDMWISMTRKDVQYAYDQDPDSEDTYQQANFLYALCFPYILRAQFLAAGSGGIVSPITPSSTTSIISPIPITSADFVDATHWGGQNSYNQPILASYELQVFWDDAQVFLELGTQWERTLTGINILEPGFDATINNYQFYIFISR